MISRDSLCIKKAPNRCHFFQVVYGLSLILTRCLVSNGFKIYSFILFLQILTDEKTLGNYFPRVLV